MLFLKLYFWAFRLSFNFSEKRLIISTPEFAISPAYSAIFEAKVLLDRSIILAPYPAPSSTNPED